MFQQSRYEIKRYNKWLFNKNNIHFSVALIYFFLELVLFILTKLNILSINSKTILLSMLITVCFTIYLVRKESNKHYIKDLVITKRVIRQIIVYTILLVLTIYLYLYLSEDYFLAGILFTYIPYFLIYPMHLITLPIEELIKKMYENDARGILNEYDNLIKIGITGSFGKTSTKNIVNDIISNSFYTLITPSSFNTPMGITRTIREQLKPIHEVFVCEMGADKVGDISYLMDFVKPKYGIVTSIGEQHLATFKSIENIINEKMQEIEMLPEDGIGFINLDNSYIENYKINNKCKIVSVGVDNTNADYVASKIKYTSEGTSFTVKINGKNYKFKTVLLGKHNVTNILIGIALAIELGIDIKQIVSSVEGISRIPHRLEVKKFYDMTLIDDAFNANPVGSKRAIDVLTLMSGKHIVCTPGMIDLGPKQDEYNYEFGKYMADKIDFALLVGEKQTKSIVQGLKDAGFDSDNIIVFKDVRDALNYAHTAFASSDTILIENDLPDAFNV